MSDDTTHDATALRAKTAALTGVAFMTLVLAALAFTLSFDALRQLALEIGVRPHNAWMAPVAIDVAQAAATLGLVALGADQTYKTGRRFCLGVATATVLLSVAGNGYHAYQLAQRNAARVAAGEDLGYIPQPAAIAAGIAMIFPLLWLALLHLFTIMLQAIKDERAHARTGATVPPTLSTSRVAERNCHDPSRGGASRQVGATTAVEVHPHPAAPEVARPATDARAIGAPEREGVVPRSATGAPATRNGWPQTSDGLHAFLRHSALTDAVKRVAVVRLDHPELNQVQVAGQLQLDKSTVSRHWRNFVVAAETEGFTVPPLPRSFDDQPELSVQSVPELQPA
ncbi:DUF2637 domain-containing protein [Rhodococcus chondri]|uniref:DUF2637 domain-containing protein n=1 Tax=Rhodococcus chondri TaxID=3065941 RepID=A0ABU7JV24_9NOCA|nr:DUF2637 domain-containing protein [Rhodococcus sp. CC-R104]MEE2033374.1 DUF2637 domain-containing protein [Rhodococcus sp. CC-R104]